MPQAKLHPDPRPIAAIRLDGGRPCLDFVNSIHDRYAAEVEDYIATPERFIEWCLRAGVLGPHEDIATPVSTAERATLMRKVRALRQHLHTLLASRIDGLTPPEEAVRHIDQWLHRAWANQSFGSDGRMHWRGDAFDVLLPLQRVALDALDLINATPAGQLRRCDNVSTCGWLFLDTSKNQRRRWCAMETCGTEFKMGRYRRA